MTITEANEIWNACYGEASEPGSWDLYTSEQRLEAIDTRQLQHEYNTGGWGSWNISDRH